MRIVNRFIQAADRLTGQRVDLKQIFHDAELTEVDHVLQALYVISSRRIDSGHPIQLEEIASAIPDLISDESVLEVAVEISIDGMIATGQRSSADAEDLSLQLSRLAEAQQSSRKLPGPENTAAARGGSRLAEVELPRDFGPPDLDGRHRYELRRVLGSGNQGIVYEAVDRLFTDQDEPVYVALKIFYPSVECCEKGQEGSIARKVRHRNVASVTDQGKTEDGENYVAYELVQGLPLDDWLSKQGTAVQTSEKLRIAIGIARGVQAAHAAGVVHRDLKPSNILIDSDSQPVISDFGIAHTKHRDPTISGRYGTRGSLAFMAPEQFRGELGKSAPLVDVYAIGGILYWMLSKRFPNGDQVAEAVEWLDSRDHGGPQRLSSDFEDSKVRAVLMRSLSLDPSERYQSAEALAHELSCVIDHLPIWGVDDDTWSRAKLFAKRNTLLTTMYAVLILLAGGVVGLILRSAYQQQMMVASMNHASEVEALNRQIEVEQVRSAGYVERMQLARTLFGSWMRTLDAEASESAVLMNLLFLHSQADGNPLIEDPEFKADLIARRVEVAIEHAEGLDEASSSPIERALWFEMIAGWLQPTQPDRAESYRLRAANLVEQYAPRDTLWLNQLRGGGVPPP